MMNEPLSSIMTRDVITAQANDPVKVAREVFMQNKVHHLPVVEGKKLIGILTIYDLFKRIHHIDDFDRLLIRDLMTTHIATLEPEDKVGAAAEVLLAKLFHAVPITKNGDLVGIVTSFDVIKYEFHKEYPTQDI